MQNIQSAYRAKILKYKSLERKYKHIKPTGNIKIYEHQFFHKHRHFSHAEAKNEEGEEKKTSSSDEENEEALPGLLIAMNDMVPSEIKDKTKIYEAIGDLVKAAQALPVQMTGVTNLVAQVAKGGPIDPDNAQLTDEFLRNNTKNTGDFDFVGFLSSEEAIEHLGNSTKKIDKIEQSWIEWAISKGWSVKQAIASFMSNIYSLLKECSWTCRTLSIIAAIVGVRVLYAAYHGTPISEEVINLYNLLELYIGKALHILEGWAVSFVRLATFQNEEFIYGSLNPFAMYYQTIEKAIETKNAIIVANAANARGLEYARVCGAATTATTAFAVGAKTTAATSASGPAAFVFGAIAATLTTVGVTTGCYMLGAGRGTAEMATILGPQHLLELENQKSNLLFVEAGVFDAVWAAVIAPLFWSYTQRFLHKYFSPDKASAKRTIDKLKSQVNCVQNLGTKVAKMKMKVLSKGVDIAKKFRNTMAKDIGLENLNFDLMETLNKQVNSKENAENAGIKQVENIGRNGEIEMLWHTRQSIVNGESDKLPKNVEECGTYIDGQRKELMKTLKKLLEKKDATLDPDAVKPDAVKPDAVGETKGETKGEINGETKGETVAVNAATGPAGPMFKQFITEHFLPTAHNF